MAYSLTWLPRVLSDAGLKVALVPGWEERGRGEMGTVRGVLCHHTAGAKNGNMPSLRLLINGRSDLPGPLSQLGLGRDGTYYIIAAGRCNHAGGGSWQSITTGNSSFIGIEAENTGTIKDFPWPAVQVDAYQRGVAAILRHVGRGAEYCAAHREYALPKGRKNDTMLDMGAFRASVAAILSGTAPPPVLIPASTTVVGSSERLPTLRRGMEDPAVARVREALGIDPGTTFGPKTEATVRAFQREHGMVADGIVGPKTWALLLGRSDGAVVVPSAVAPAPVATPVILVREVAEEPTVPRLFTTPTPAAETDTELEAAHDRLRGVTQTLAIVDWGEELGAAVQRALAELYLLNPDDDVDGKPGARTLQAWSLFRAGAGLPPAATIDPASAAALIAKSSDRDAFIGKLKIDLPENFRYRRSQRTANKEASVAAMIRLAKAQKLTPAQTAYVLATAEHESDRFATLEEYDPGRRYEGRRDLGNSKPGDGPLYKGRGYVQLTGRNNYTAYGKLTGLDLVRYPTILMNWAPLSAWVIVDGMTRGAYTGKPLNRYVNKDSQDFKAARYVVNGQDQAEKIARQAMSWIEQLS